MFLFRSEIPLMLVFLLCIYVLEILSNMYICRQYLNFCVTIFLSVAYSISIVNSESLSPRIRHIFNTFFLPSRNLDIAIIPISRLRPISYERYGFFFKFSVAKNCFSIFQLSFLRVGTDGQKIFWFLI